MVCEPSSVIERRSLLTLTFVNESFPLLWMASRRLASRVSLLSPVDSRWVTRALSYRVDVGDVGVLAEVDGYVVRIHVASD